MSNAWSKVRILFSDSAQQSAHDSPHGTNPRGYSVATRTLHLHSKRLTQGIDLKLNYENTIHEHISPPCGVLWLGNCWEFSKLKIYRSKNRRYVLPHQRIFLTTEKNWTKFPAEVDHKKQSDRNLRWLLHLWILPRIANILVENSRTLP